MMIELTYDARRYTELLAEICNSVTEPFDCKIILKINYATMIFTVEGPPT